MRPYWLVLALIYLGIPPLSARTIEIHGSVSDDYGAPLVGARVELLPMWTAEHTVRHSLRHPSQDSSPPAVATSRSTDDGRFLMVAPHPDMWQLVVRHDGHLAATFDLQPLLDDLWLLPVQLPRRATVTLHIHDVSRRPVPGLQVKAQSRPSSPRGHGWRPAAQTAISDSHGRLQLSAHADELLTIAALGDTHFLYEDLPAGTSTATRTLQEPLVSLQLQDAHGHPAPDVAVAIRRPFGAVALSDAGGILRLPWRTSAPGTVPFMALDTKGPRGALRSTSRSSETSSLEQVLTLKLPSLVELRAQVIDEADGSPIADAWIWAGPSYQRSDRRGKVRLQLPKRQQLQVGVAAVGYAPQRLTIPWADVQKRPLDIALSVSTRLPGRILDPEGQPLAGAEIIASPQRRQIRQFTADGIVERLHDPAQQLPSLRSTNSQIDGRFQVRDLQPEIDYLLEVRHPDFPSRVVSLAAVVKGTLAPRLEIPLMASCTMAGIVLDSEGQPLAGAIVELQSSAARFADTPSALSDASGEFSISGWTCGRFALRASAAGYVSRTLSGLEMPNGQTHLDDTRLTLQTTTTLQGQVTDNDDQGIAAVRIVARPQALFRPGDSVTTLSDAEGHFELEGIDPGTAINLRLSHRNFQEGVYPGLRPAPDEALHVVLQPGIAVRGRVINEVDAGVAGLAVEMQRSTADGTSTQETVSDGQGHFLFSGQAPGSVTLTVASRHGRVPPQSVELRQDRVPEPITLVLAAGSVLEGQVMDAEGQPLAVASLRLRQVASSDEPQATTKPWTGVPDTQGGFRVAGLVAGSYRLSAQHPDFESVEIDLQLDDATPQWTEVVFRQRRQTRTLRGTVLDAQGGGLGHAELRLLASDLGGNTVGQTLSRVDGHFELSVPHDGTYVVAAEHPEFAPQRSPPIHVDGGPVDGLTLQLFTGGSISGQILGLSHEALSGLSLVAHSSQHGGRTVAVDETGYYQASNLAPGTWNLTARRSHPVRVASDSLRLASGESAHLDLHFPIGHQVRGVVLAAGPPLPGADLLLHCPGDLFRQRTRADGGGGFTIEDVPTAHCVVTATDPHSGRVRQQSIDVRGDLDLQLDVGSSG